jgi:endonuclease YncB( thermonuclease family)
LRGNSKVAIVPIESDRYGRLVAEVFANAGSDNEIFANGEMVRQGLAYHYEAYSDNCPNQSDIATAQEMAKESNAGLWSQPGALKPWAWRKKN